MTYDDNKYYEYVNLSVNEANINIPFYARNVLVSLNEHWKIPMG